MDRERYSVTIEVPVFLVFFLVALSGPINTNFVMYRTCYVILGHNESACALLGSGTTDNATKELEKEVEPLANDVATTTSVLADLLPAMMCLFIGPWSDRNGRKKIMTFSLFGLMLTYLIRAIIARVPDMSPWWLLSTSFTATLTGGIASFMMVVLCYITDISTIENRGMRMAIFEASLALGTLTGTLSSPYLLKWTGYVGVYLICSASAFLASLFTCVRIRETVVCEETQSLFTLKLLKEMLETTVRRRADRRRAVLFLLLSSLVLYIFIIMDGNLMFLYTRLKFDWSLDKYTVYSSCNSVLLIIGAVGSVYLLNKKLKVPEMAVVLIGYATLAVGSTLEGLGHVELFIYIAMATRSLTGSISPMIRTMVSKVVDADEVGKIFSLLLACESLAGLVAVSCYTAIYNATIDVFPGTFCLVKTGLYAVNIGIVVTIMLLLRKRREDEIPYDTLSVNT